MELEFVPLPNGVGSEIRGLDPREIDEAGGLRSERRSCATACCSYEMHG